MIESPVSVAPRLSWREAPPTFPILLNMGDGRGRTSPNPAAGPAMTDSLMNKKASSGQ
ncbi:hypothetical protein ACLEDK_07300 [Lonsdalea quercina]|uniref:hypothetical protein n=1 Tax=Lonsdalea quercina TaxID=71657 RepID=UPI0039765F03